MSNRDERKLNLLNSTEDHNDERLSDLEDELKMLRDLHGEFTNLTEVDSSEAVEQLAQISRLEEDIQALRELSVSFHEYLGVQGEQLNEVEEHIEKTEVAVEEADVSLEKASVLAQLYRSRTVRTVGGAAVGGLLFGGVGSVFFGIAGVLVGTGVGGGSGAIVGALTG